VAQAERSFAPATDSGSVKIAAASPVVNNYVISSNAAVTAIPSSKGKIGDFTGSAATDQVELPNVAGHSSTTAMNTATQSSSPNAPPASNVHFIEEGEATADPNLYISLNQLGACVDQSEEDRLRTELAVRLDRGGIFPCGEMKFDINYVETGQTVQMRIYNPRHFADKCAALLSAIECINHSK